MSHVDTTLTRDTEVFQIPSGARMTLPAGMRVQITQSLGGSYTVAGVFGLARINAEDADALGVQAATAASPAAETGAAAELNDEELQKAVWDRLKTCYDPEIPVNIVDLGLIYDCRVERPTAAATGASVNVKMTLTAPGCGMGPHIAGEAQHKILGIPGISDANVELVWDPPWNPGMISEAGKMKLGMI